MYWHASVTYDESCESGTVLVEPGTPAEAVRLLRAAGFGDDSRKDLVRRPATDALSEADRKVLSAAAASTYRQSALDMTDPGAMGYLDEPTSFLLHQLTTATQGACMTHTVAVSGAAAVQFAIASG